MMSQSVLVQVIKAVLLTRKIKSIKMDNKLQQLITRKDVKLPHYSFKKQSRLDYEIQSLKTINSQKQKLFRQNYELLGNPKNEYLIKKIRNYVNNVYNINKNKVKTEEGKSNYTTIKTTIDISEELSNRSSERYRIEERDVSRAYLINQSEKIQRLIARKAEQEEERNCLSQRIKAKLNQKKPSKVQSKTLKPIQKITWYQKWYKAESHQKSRKKVQIFQKLKHSNFRRFHTEEILPNQQYS